MSDSNSMAGMQEMTALLASLQKEAPVHADTAPCWAAAVSEIEAAASERLVPEEEEDEKKEVEEASTIRSPLFVDDMVETAVEKLLVWAQGAREADATGEHSYYHAVYTSALPPYMTRRTCGGFIPLNCGGHWQRSHARL